MIIQRLSYGKPKTQKKKKNLNCELKFIIASFNTKSENKTRNIYELQCNLKGYRAEALKETTLNYL